MNKSLVNPRSGFEQFGSSGPSLIRSHSASESEKCSICQSRNKTDMFFATCLHSGSCVRCAEEQMMDFIFRQKKYPTCFLNPECGAPMLPPGSRKQISHYFTSEGKAIYEKFYQKYANPISIYKTVLKCCEVPDCKGVISNRRCTKCKTYYCEICKKPSHPFSEKCSKPNDLDILGLKECPNCRMNYIREEGCHHVKCPQCNHEFCEFCLKPWTIWHHQCRDRIYQPKSNQSCRIF